MNIIRRFLEHRKLRKRYKELRSVVRDILASDDDILSPADKTKLTALRTEIASARTDDPVAIASLEKKLSAVADRHSFFYSVRGLLDVLAVALSVAFGIRALFLQPFKIPTSSMQPTLFGIHYIDRKEAESYQGLFTKLFLPFGYSRAELTSETGGDFREGSIPFSRTIPSLLANLFSPLDFFFDASRVVVGNTYHTLPGSDVRSTIYRYLDASPEGRRIAPGETVLDGYLSSGDHLFVDRFSLHFKPLERGEIFIFNTENLRTRQGIPLPGYYYIKRIAGMPGDTIRIQNDVLYVKPAGASEFRRADELSPRFKKLYSGKGGYQGHRALGLLANGREFKVPDDAYFALGDNTNNSLDSREWNVVPRRNIIGRAFSVFWPVSRRWGFIDGREPLPCDTVIPPATTQPTAMRRQ